MGCFLTLDMWAMQELAASADLIVEKTVSVATKVHGAPVICCAIYGVLCKVQKPAWLPDFLGPEKIQQDLFVCLEKENTKFTNAAAEAQPGKSWPKVVKAWLLGEIDGKQVCKLARKHIGLLDVPRYVAAGKAFEPEAAEYLVPIKENVAALQECKKAGCTLVLVSNWRRDCFKPLVEQKTTKDVLALFDEDKRFISEDLKMLTSNEAFFNRVKKSVNANNDAASQFFYLDIPLGQESLDAAQKAGMTPITASSETSLAAQLAAQGVPIASENAKLGK